MTGKLGVTLLALCFSAACMVAAAASQTSQGDKQVDRTTPIVNKMTPPQREHAELHRTRGFGSNVRVLDRKVTVDVFSDYHPTTPTKGARELLVERTCSVDAVFLGHVLSVDVLPVSDGTALFSDYTVQLAEVFRTGKGLTAFPGVKVVITRPGGVTTVEGETVGTVIRAYPPLTVGNDYVFFLKHLPQYSTFDARSAVDILAVESGVVRSLVPFAATDANLLTNGISYLSFQSWLRGITCG